MFNIMIRKFGEMTFEKAGVARTEEEAMALVLVALRSSPEIIDAEYVTAEGEIKEIKAVAKELGVKGFRKLKLSRETYVIGQQGQYLDENSAIVLLNKITRYGFQIEQYKTCFELYEKGLLDTLTIVRA
ncbi:type I 3-dehydroquinate dehydratase [Escherichia coli]|nr:type I 3-dehydroquinate dehydratase [Escherichia coli]EFN3240354.1 type I 3-dehydroquinate dehydratase [Escherichia coli]HAX4931126.1 type I 3-dehydroquinate dehydratase [Escherichia coli]HAX4964033.1 type I 3-dehydroquinate dehydratase [Escherichia coli]HAX4983191.1 type I 3-dehydroquinate dehydratase [Escherichia coli]